MGKSKVAYKDLTNEEKIDKNRKALRKLFKEIAPEKAQFTDGLIYQFAVTIVTMERLADEVTRGDVIENFKQGKQEMRRENPALRSYNTTMKSFSALAKQLIDLLPITKSKEAGEALMNFVANPPGAGKR